MWNVFGLLPHTWYDGEYHNPGASIWGSKKLITGCVILRGCDKQRAPVMEWMIHLGLYILCNQGGVL